MFLWYISMFPWYILFFPWYISMFPWYLLTFSFVCITNQINFVAGADVNLLIHFPNKSLWWQLKKIFRLNILICQKWFQSLNSRVRKFQPNLLSRLARNICLGATGKSFGVWKMEKWMKGYLERFWVRCKMGGKENSLKKHRNIWYFGELDCCIWLHLDRFLNN